MIIIENKSKAFKILGLDPNSTLDDIKKAFKNLSLKFHPDKGGNNDEFIKIKSAYDICCSLASNLKKMNNVTQKLFITLDEAYFGCSKFLNFSGNTRCCNKRFHNSRIFDVNCPKGCNQGFIQENKKVEVKIPPRSNNCSIILKGLGDQAVFEDEINGDLIIDVEIKNQFFTILPNGDLQCNISIDWKYAIAGQEILINHPRGELKLKTWDYGIIQNNDEVAIDGYGIAENSKLLVKFTVQKPDKPLSETIRKTILVYLNVNNHIVAPKFN